MLEEDELLLEEEELLGEEEPVDDDVARLFSDEETDENTLCEELAEYG